jgi:hypothetical protein
VGSDPDFVLNDGIFSLTISVRGNAITTPKGDPMKKGYVITNPCAWIHNQTPAVCYGYACTNPGPPGKVYSRQVRRQTMHNFQRDERKA